METCSWARLLWFRDLHEAEGSWNLRSPPWGADPTHPGHGCWTLPGKKWSWIPVSHCNLGWWETRAPNMAEACILPERAKYVIKQVQWGCSIDEHCSSFSPYHFGELTTFSFARGGTSWHWPWKTYVTVTSIHSYQRRWAADAPNPKTRPMVSVQHWRKAIYRGPENSGEPRMAHTWLFVVVLSGWLSVWQ